ncbi:helix-turn-helix domain-containing protein [Rhodococcus sp. APC 3903]|uniref:PucR family transcriptional regulator n=1 Tax=Rhodococcus sp. APC 3903 TaxID=3035193 RepID=UPI0025B2A8A4|nr:helix-turn-helix domain-containing protein [Rhodococcus sp. APC 3903]MDN3459915.1 helix-turn-helix domain-containing protein [Rhodococcus sp. APC 3903]
MTMHKPISPSVDTAEDVLRVVATDMLSNVQTMSRSISAVVAERQPPPTSMEEKGYLEVLNRSTEVNVTVFLSTLAYGLPADGVEPPVGAIDLVDCIACDPEGLPLLLRVYRLGAAATWQCFVEFVGTQVEDGHTLAKIVLIAGDHLNTYADHIVECLSLRWSERTQRMQQDGRRQESALRAVLGGADPNTESLDYSFERYHVAIAIGQGIGHERNSALEFARIIRSRHATGSTLELDGYKGLHLLWISTKNPIPQQVWENLTSKPSAGLHVAVSDVGRSAEGFVVVAHEACETAHALARIDPSGGAATFRNMALTVTLLADPVRARRFANVVLGPLAVKTVEAERMRSTLEAYFRCGSSKISASAVLHVHEKTVATRLRHATDLIGSSIDARRPELEAALAVFAALD